MNKPLLALWACALVLAGCVHSTKARFVQHYALNVSAPPAPAAVRTNRDNDAILQLASIVVPDWLDGTAMYYRLDYTSGDRLSSYANSEWIAPPAALLEPLLQKAILAGGDWRAVIGPRNSADADVSLQLRLDDFSQTFSQQHASAGVLDATATLVSNRDQHVIAQRHFHVEAAAPTADAQGGVKALGAASTQFATELQRWLQQTQ